MIYTEPNHPCAGPGRARISRNTHEEWENSNIPILRKMGIESKETKSFFFPDGLSGKDLCLYLRDKYSLKSMAIIMVVFEVKYIDAIGLFENTYSAKI